MNRRNHCWGLISNKIPATGADTIARYLFHFCIQRTCKFVHVQLHVCACVSISGTARHANLLLCHPFPLLFPPLTSVFRLANCPTARPFCCGRLASVAPFPFHFLSWAHCGTFMPHTTPRGTPTAHHSALCSWLHILISRRLRWACCGLVFNICRHAAHTPHTRVPHIPPTHTRTHVRCLAGTYEPEAYYKGHFRYLARVVRPFACVVSL